MNITLPSGTAAIDSAVGTVPQRRFRRTWTLNLITDEFAEKIVLEPVNSWLQAKFLPYSFNIGSAAIQRKDDKTVVVTLDQPLQVESIRTDSSMTGSLELYRIDGSTVASEPTVTQAIASSQANLLSKKFTAAQFAIRLKNKGTLSPNEIKSVRIKSYPTTPSIGLLDTRQEFPSIIPIWLEPFSSAGSLNLNSQLTKPLQRYLDSLDFPANGSLALTLVAESDAPCQIQISAFSLAYHLKREQFLTTPDKPKRTLRFTGGMLAPQSIDIELPPNSQLRAASIRLADSSQPADPLIASTSLPMSSAAAPLLTQRTGIQTNLGQWIAQPFVCDRAQKINGLSLALLPLHLDTQLILELHTDAKGQPSGKIVSRTTLRLQTIGRLHWYAVSFDPVILDSQPYWWLLGTAQGAAVWVADETIESGDIGIYIFGRSDFTQVFETIQHFAKKTALFQLKEVDTSAQTDADNRERENAIAFHLNNIPLTAVREKNNIAVDLASTLTSALASTPSTTSQAATTAAKLMIAVSTPTILTVYPPVIEYDWPVS